jgi:organic radical activating enzyme
MLTWVLNNICTNHCSYCPEEIHTGANHHYEWHHAQHFINACFSKYDSVHCSISGGEPTVSPFFKDLINLIYDRNGSVHLTTNLVRPKHYWEDIAGKFTSISTSYHPEFMTNEEQEDEFIEKVQYLATQTPVTVRVMMLPTLWDRCYAFYKKLIKNNTRCGIELVRILPNFGVGENYCTIEYSPEQEEILATTAMVPGTTDTYNIKGYRQGPMNSVMHFDTGTSVPLDHSTQTALQNNKLTNFRNWQCNVGLESLFVHFNGDVMRGNCGVGGVVGNITRMQESGWPKEPVICHKNICHCTADVILSKKAIY